MNKSLNVLVTSAVIIQVHAQYSKKCNFHSDKKQQQPKKQISKTPPTPSYPQNKPNKQTNKKRNILILINFNSATAATESVYIQFSSQLPSRQNQNQCRDQWLLYLGHGFQQW